jgi:hypothetical protein
MVVQGIYSRAVRVSIFKMESRIARDAGLGMAGKHIGQRIVRNTAITAFKDGGPDGVPQKIDYSKIDYNAIQKSLVKSGAMEPIGKLSDMGVYLKERDFSELKRRLDEAIVTKKIPPKMSDCEARCLEFIGGMYGNDAEKLANIKQRLSLISVEFKQWKSIPRPDMIGSVFLETIPKLAKYFRKTPERFVQCLDLVVLLSRSCHPGIVDPYVPLLASKHKNNPERYNKIMEMLLRLAGKDIYPGRIFDSVIPAIEMMVGKDPGLFNSSLEKVEKIYVNLKAHDRCQVNEDGIESCAKYFKKTGNVGRFVQALDLALKLSEHGFINEYTLRVLHELDALFKGAPDKYDQVIAFATKLLENGIDPNHPLRGSLQHAHKVLGKYPDRYERALATIKELYCTLKLKSDISKVYYCFSDWGLKNISKVFAHNPDMFEFSLSAAVELSKKGIDPGYLIGSNVTYYLCKVFKPNSKEFKLAFIKLKEALICFNERGFRPKDSKKIYDAKLQQIVECGGNIEKYNEIIDSLFKLKKKKVSD